MQDGFPYKLPIEELASHLANLSPWCFHTVLVPAAFTCISIVQLQH
jgi:hypothetical protein